MAIAWDPLARDGDSQHQQGLRTHSSTEELCLSDSDAYNDESGNERDPFYDSSSEAVSGIGNKPDSTQTLKRTKASKRRKNRSGFFGKNAPPTEWPYLYNIEIWHERSLSYKAISKSSSEGDY
jgi:hypothetical protein